MENLGDVIQAVARKFNCTYDEAGRKMREVMKNNSIPSLCDAGKYLLLQVDKDINVLPD